MHSLSIPPTVKGQAKRIERSNTWPADTVSDWERAERRLLGTLLCDASFDDATRAGHLAKMIEAGIAPKSFYVPANRVIFAKLIELHDTDEAPAMHPLGIALGAKLEEVGGWPALAEIADAAPTSAHLEADLAAVREAAARRPTGEALAAARVALDLGDLASVGALAVTINGILGKIESVAPQAALSVPIIELIADAEGREADNLLGNGFLRRGQGGLIVGPTGIGKSSLTMQAAFLWASGESFFGIRPQAPLRTLIIQSENDDTDLTEMRDGILAGLKLSAGDRERVAANVRTRRCFVSGAAFLSELGRELRKHPADLVLIDPLFAFAGCDLVNQAELSHFLRELFQPFLIEHNIGGILIHHTNKPQAAKPGTGPRSGDHAYFGSGHNELANWPRFVASVRNLGSRTVFELRIGKRWQRAGICDTTGGAIDNLLIQHGKSGIYWQSADADDLARTLDTGVEGKSTKGADKLFKVFNRCAKEGRLHVLELAKKLHASRRNTERKFESGPLRDGDDVLVLRDGFVVAIEARE